MSTATFWGYVTDPQGAAVTGAAVTIANQQTGVAKVTKTNDVGLYEMQYLLSGTYRITVEMQGFSKLERTGITLTAGQKARTDLRLEVGRLDSVVTVTGEAPALNLSSNELGTLVDRGKIAELPLSGRSFLSLLTLSNGSASGRNQGRQVFNFNGGPASGTNYTMDGTDATAIEGQSLGFASNSLTLTSLDSIQEIRVSSSAYSAEVARSSSGAVNVITRGGTNEFHGNAFEYLRNNALDANSFFSNRSGTGATPLRQNQFGSNVGGPILRNRLFFYVGHEGLRTRSTGYSSGNLPTAQLKKRAATELQTFLNALPEPTQATGNADVGIYGRVIATTRREDTATGRVDWQASSRDSLFVRYNLLNTNYLTEAMVPGVTTPQVLRHQVATLSYTRTMNSRTVGEFRFGYNNYYYLNLSNRSSLPLNGTLSVSGLSLPSPPRTIVFPDKSRTIAANLSYVNGRHSMKAGFEAYRSNSAQQDWYLPVYAFNSLTDFAANRPSTITYNYGTGNYISFGPGQTWQQGYFFQDDFRVSKRLTLNLGVRYEYFMVPKDGDGRTPNVVSSLTGSFRATGEPLFAGDRNNFSPRIGFALSAAPKTSVRGGFGLFTSPPHQSQVKTTLTSNIVAAKTYIVAVNPDLKYPYDPASAVANTVTASNRTVVDPERRDTYTAQWNLNVQREIAKDTVFEAGYVGTRGLKILLNTWENRYNPVLGQRPVSTVGDVRFIQWRGDSIYHAFQTSLKRRMAGGLTFDLNYTWAHLIDIAGGAEMARLTSEIQDYNNLRGSRANADVDLRQRFVGTARYELPIAKWLHRRSRLWDGWSVSSIVSSQTGLPLMITTGKEAGEKISGVQRPNYTGAAVRLQSADPAASPLLNIAAYSTPSANATTKLSFGDVGRNVERLFGSVGMDLSLAKKTAITERHSIEFRSEFFNLPNHTNFSTIDGSTASVRFGLATAANSPRTVQLSLRYSF